MLIRILLILLLAGCQPEVNGTQIDLYCRDRSSFDYEALARCVTEVKAMTPEERRKIVIRH